MKPAAPEHTEKGAAQDSRPHCVRCRRPMKFNGSGRFRCRACDASASTSARRLKPCRSIERPACGFCGMPKAVAGKPYKFICTRCGAVRRALRRNPAAAVSLHRQITNALPGYLTPDEREDAAQSVMLDILTAKLAPRVPPPITLRRYAGRAVGLVRNPKFISLSQPTGDGREFGDHLAA